MLKNGPVCPQTLLLQLPGVKAIVCQTYGLGEAGDLTHADERSEVSARLRRGNRIQAEQIGDDETSRMMLEMAGYERRTKRAHPRSRETSESTE